MKRNLLLPLLAIVSFTMALYSCKKEEDLSLNQDDQLALDHNRWRDCNQEDITATVSVYSTGFNNPRGLKFGPDGYLYVAEGGTGGTTPPPPGGCGQDSTITSGSVYFGSETNSRISRVDPNGVRSTYASNFPSTIDRALVYGVADIEFVNNDLYALLDGGGCAHGVPSIGNGIFKINANGSSRSQLADLSAFARTNTVQFPSFDYDPEGSWYSMVHEGSNLYALSANHAELVRVSTANGNIKRVVDFSPMGHIVPDAMVLHNGNLYVGCYGAFFQPNKGIFKITPGGQVTQFATGFVNIIGMVFDKAGGLYVLENWTGAGFFNPGSGDIIRIDPNGSRKTVVTGLMFPTAITMGPDNNLYVSNIGMLSPAIFPLNSGQVLKITIGCSNTNRHHSESDKN